MPYLAQVNVSRGLWPIDDPRMAGFVERLEQVNAEAEAAEGFIWRFQLENGDATGQRILGDDRLLFNMSLWASVEALKKFVYRSAVHVNALRNRKSWFEPGSGETVLWWTSDNARLDIKEGLRRLEILRTSGHSAAAFTFHRPYDPQGSLITGSTNGAAP